MATDRPHVVALGGGTGMRSLLSGLHAEDCDVCAIITVADDGGSSGRLRREFDIPPPGDIRNCLVALSDADPLIGEMFQYRFDDPLLKGHSFGNLFLAVLTKITGNFRLAIDRARELLSVRGKVLPSTDRLVVLVAEHPDGSKSTGEQAISHSGKTISRVQLVPQPPPISDEIRDHIARADVICLGPGSLYTSIVPNLLVPGMVDAINSSSARVVYVGNLMTQPGETDGFDLEAHVEALLAVTGGMRIDVVIHRSDAVDEERVTRYAEQGSLPVRHVDGDRVCGIPLRRVAVIESGDHVRHSPSRLARALIAELGVPREGD